jgi:toxin ParE1/3/4
MQSKLQVRWTPSAARDLKEISRYIRRDNPQAARAVAKRLYDEAERLNTLPGRGRVGKIPGTRELIIPGLPYIIVYRITADAVHIFRIYHGAQDWPGQS